MPFDKSAVPQDESSQSPENLKNLRLSDLEEHISRQIMRLSKEVDEGSLGLAAPEESKELSLEMASFVPPLETMASLDLPFKEDSNLSFKLSHTDVERSYLDNVELLRNVHDLSDLLTDTVRQLSIRLNSLEEKITLASQETRTQLSQLLTAAKNQPSNTTKADKENVLLADGNSDLLAELTRHLLTLETRLDKDRGELKQKIDERTGGLADRFDNKLQELESLAQQTRDYLGRHFFSLAILLVIITFIAGALVTNSLDRMATYLTQSIDALRTELGELTLPPTNTREPRFPK